MRKTKQRDAVLKVVLNSCDHPSAEMVYLRTRDQMPSISLGTVYRNLCQLAKMKLIRQVHVKDGADRFDKTLKPHSHFHCRICLRLCDIDFDLSESEAIKEVAKDTNHSIENAEVHLSGICSSCKEAKNQNLSVLQQ